jgi:hypothetical protein
MSKSFFMATKESQFAAGSANFASLISATPVAFGLTAAQASSYAALNTTYQTAYTAATTDGTRSKSLVAAKNSAKVPLKQMASDLARIINGTPTVTDEQKVTLGVSVRSTPSPRPAPGTPYKFTVQLQSDGSLLLGWKCNNPKGASGTMYQVFRRTGSSGEFTYLGGAGTRSFLDDSIPAGTSLVTYRIQAVRSTSVGDWAEYNVNFGTGGSAPVVEEVVPMRKAA